MSAELVRSVLLVDDDAVMAVTIMDALEEVGYTVRRATTGREAKAMVASMQPDLIILELILPDMDGLVLLDELRSRWGAPVIICSDSIRRRDRVLGLKLGAADYITKPFDRDEFLARVEAALRYAGARKPAEEATAPIQPQQERVGELVIDRGRRRVTLGGTPIKVTPTEYRLLCALAAEPGEVVSREQLAEQVWGYADASVGRTIDSHVMRIRSKLNAGTVPAPSIVSVRGFGYKIGPDIAAAPRRPPRRPHRVA